MPAPPGVGAMGEVWKAHDARLDRTVAIRVSAAECEALSDIVANLTSAIMSREPPSVSGLAPATLDHIIRRCLAKIRTTVGRWQGIWCWRCA